LKVTAFVLLIVVGAAWYAFRPERLFIDQKVNEQFPNAAAANNQLAAGQFHSGAHLVPFHEYFNGDNGSGIGASHQTGWIALRREAPSTIRRMTLRTSAFSASIIIFNAANAEIRRGPQRKSEST